MQAIQEHLFQTNDRLQKRDVSHLSEAQRFAREQALAHLFDYAVAGQFPQNRHPKKNHERSVPVPKGFNEPGSRTPIFVDERGVHCAVGHLMRCSASCSTTQQTKESLSGRDEDLVKEIVAQDNFGYLLEMSPESQERAQIWAEQNGFTVKELAEIQPAYPCDCFNCSECLALYGNNDSDYRDSDSEPQNDGEHKTDDVGSEGAVTGSVAQQEVICSDTCKEGHQLIKTDLLNRRDAEEHLHRSSKGNSDSKQDMFGDCQEFAKLFSERTGNHFSGKIDRKFITRMVTDELQELAEAKDETEEVDALLDAVYYILNHLASTGLDIRPVWSLIHRANMTKFGPGGYKRDDGKWCKPPDFIPPDDEIRKVIELQRSQNQQEK